MVTSHSAKSNPEDPQHSNIRSLESECCHCLLTLHLLSLAPIACAQGRAECATIKSAILARPVRYCAFLPASFDTDKTRRYPVLYYLHGLGDNEQSLLNFGGWDLIEDMRRSGKIGEFVVLAPSGGHTFFINSADGKIRYEDFLTKEFMPQMEKKYRVETLRARRGITGVSMGGFGALRLAFKYPQQFAAVSAQMPALLAEIPRELRCGRPGLARVDDGRRLRQSDRSRLLRAQQCLLFCQSYTCG